MIKQTIDGVPLDALMTLLAEPRPDAPHCVLEARAQLCALLDAPRQPVEGPRTHVAVVERSVGPSHGFEGVILATAIINEMVKPGDKLYAASGASITLGEKNLGNYGSLYDGPGVRRAYTYKHQPGNQEAHAIGVAAHSVGIGGDAIDKGLKLLCELERAGYGVFAI